jgi:hypothetical protein
MFYLHVRRPARMSNCRVVHIVCFICMCAQAFKPHSRRVAAAAYSPDGSWLATGNATV